MRPMKTYTYLIVVLFCMGCNHVERKYSLRVLTASYQEGLEALDVPDAFLNHYPRALFSHFTYMDSQSQLQETSCIYSAFYEYNVNKERLDSLVYNLQNQKIAQYRPTDSSLIVLGKNRKIRKAKREDTEFSKINQNPYYIIPYFYERDWDNNSNYPHKEEIYANTLCGLSEKFIIYVLESEPYIFKTALPNLEDTPVGWERGYSKGISINKEKQTVIYWLIIW